MRVFGWISLVILSIITLTGLWSTSIGGLAIFLGAIGFWTIVIIGSMVICYATENEKYTSDATLSILLTLLLIQLFTPIKPLTTLISNPKEAVECFLGYLVVGLGWSFIKWYSFLKTKESELEEIKNNFCKTQKISPSTPFKEFPENAKYKWKEHLQRHRVYGIPQAKDHKATIVNWMCYWPWSLIATLLKDWVRKIFTRLQELLSNLYQRIADHIFKNIRADFEIETMDTTSEE